MIISQLSDEALIAEYRMWEKKIAEATSWGAALTAASEFRRACRSELKRRGLWPISQ